MGGYRDQFRNLNSNPIAWAITIVLAGLLCGLLYLEHLDEQKQAAKIEVYNKELRAKEQESLNAWNNRIEEIQAGSFYQILEDSRAIQDGDTDGSDGSGVATDVKNIAGAKSPETNILIVGDSIGAQAGDGSSSSSSGYGLLLKQYLQDTYGVKAHIKNVSMGGNASYAGYVRTMERDGCLGKWNYPSTGFGADESNTEGSIDAEVPALDDFTDYDLPSSYTVKMIARRISTSIMR